MYNFDFMKDEQLIEIFEEVLVKQNSNEKIISVVLTDKRLLLMNYITNDGMEALRITKGINLVRYKEVFYEIDLNNVMDVLAEEYYKIILNDNTFLEFNNKRLYQLLKMKIQM